MKTKMNYQKQKICKMCGVEYTAYSQNSKYCSDECRKAGELEVQRIAYAKKQAKLLAMFAPKGTELSVLALKARLARDAEGSKLSYGQYVALNKL